MIEHWFEFDFYHLQPTQILYNPSVIIKVNRFLKDFFKDILTRFSESEEKVTSD